MEEKIEKELLTIRIFGDFQCGKSTFLANFLLSRNYFSQKQQDDAALCMQVRPSLKYAALINSYPDEGHQYTVYPHTFKTQFDSAEFLLTECPGHRELMK